MFLDCDSCLNAIHFSDLIKTYQMRRNMCNTNMSSNSSNKMNNSLHITNYAFKMDKKVISKYYAFRCCTFLKEKTAT